MLRTNPEKNALYRVTSLPGMNAVCAALMGAGMLFPLASAHAQAEDVPLYLTLSQSFQHDSNVLKDNRRKESDVISSTQLRVGLDKQYGRQYYNLDATLAKNKYKENSLYDNDSHNASGRFVTDIMADFRLSLNGSSSRQLASFETNNQLDRSARVVDRVTNYGADLRYGLYGKMSVNLGLSRYEFERDANYLQELVRRDNRQSDTAT